jgi:hypothetical protein
MLSRKKIQPTTHWPKSQTKKGMKLQVYRKTHKVNNQPPHFKNETQKKKTHTYKKGI